MENEIDPFAIMGRAVEETERIQTKAQIHIQRIHDLSMILDKDEVLPKNYCVDVLESVSLFLREIAHIDKVQIDNSPAAFGLSGFTLEQEEIAYRQWKIFAPQDKKINAIKEIRARATGLGLKEAKELYEWIEKEYG